MMTGYEALTSSELHQVHGNDCSLNVHAAPAVSRQARRNNDTHCFSLTNDSNLFHNTKSTLQLLTDVGLDIVGFSNVNRRL